MFRPKSSLELDRLSFEINALEMLSSTGWNLSARQLAFATRRDTEKPFAHDIWASALDVTPQGTFEDLTAELGLPDRITEIGFDLTATFDRPWDRFSVEDSRPQPVQLELREVKAHWGDLLLQATADLDIDRAGIPTGELHIQARNWRTMFDLLVAADTVPPSILPAMESGLNLLAGMSGNPNHIDAKLALRGGSVFLGPFAIGQTPRLLLR